MSNFWKGSMLSLVKHITSVRFIPLEQMKDEDIPSPVDMSDSDKRKFYNKGQLAGFFEVTFDQHTYNAGTNKKPKYHGGQRVYLYPANKDDAKDFKDDKIDPERFYRW